MEPGCAFSNVFGAGFNSKVPDVAHLRSLTSSFEMTGGCVPQ